MPLNVPRTLSPSKVSSFTDCPLAFRLSVIDRLPQPPSPHALKGTLVHSALEALFWEHPRGARTPAAAAAALLEAWGGMQQDPEFAELGLAPDEAAEFVTDALLLIDNYFELEDPNAVETVGTEIGLETMVGSMRLRGIIDRLDITEEGELVVIDYKTGRAPAERHERGRLSSVHIYALLCEAVLGRTPVEVRLLHLRDPIQIVAVPSEQSIRGQRQRTAAVWRAIERACVKADFQPRTGPLCRSCNFREYCPAFGGAPPGEQQSGAA